MTHRDSYVPKNATASPTAGKVVASVMKAMTWRRKAAAMKPEQSEGQHMRVQSSEAVANGAANDADDAGGGSKGET